MSTKLLLLLCFLSLSGEYVYTQGDEEKVPVRWLLEIDRLAKALIKSDSFSASLSAKIDKGWHLYALERIEDGPIPTRISIAEGQPFELGKIGYPEPIEVDDPAFGVATKYYEDSVTFVLPIKVLVGVDASSSKLQVKVRFQTCNDRKCLPAKTVTVESAFEIAVAGAVVGSDAVRPSGKPETGSSAPTAVSKPVEFDFVDFTGKSRKLSEFRGRFVLLDFWATWCKPCLADIPKLKELYEKYKAGGFEVIGMDSETIGDEAEAPDPEFAKATAARAKQIVATRGVTWTQATSETAVPVAMKIFGVKSLPTKILIDRNGNMIATIGEKDDLKGIVEQLLSAKK